MSVSMSCSLRMMTTVDIIHRADDDNRRPRPAVMPVLLEGVQLPLGGFHLNHGRYRAVTHEKIRASVTHLVQAMHGHAGNLPQRSNDLRVILVNAFWHLIMNGPDITW